MKKFFLAYTLLLSSVLAYSQSIKLNTYTTSFQWSNEDVLGDKLYHFQTQDYANSTEVSSALSASSDKVQLAKPINYGVNLAYAPEKLNFGKGALYLVFGFSKLVQQEMFNIIEVTNAENGAYEQYEGKFFINRSYVTSGFTWEETLLSKEKWGLVLGFEYLFHLNTNTNSHVTVRKDTQNGIEFVNSMQRIDVPGVNIFSSGMQLSPNYKLGTSSSISLDLGFRILNYLNKKVYDKSQLNPSVGLAYRYKF